MAFYMMSVDFRYLTFHIISHVHDGVPLIFSAFYNSRLATVGFYIFLADSPWCLAWQVPFVYLAFKWFALISITFDCCQWIAIAIRWSAMIQIAQQPPIQDIHPMHPYVYGRSLSNIPDWRIAKHSIHTHMYAHDVFAEAYKQVNPRWFVMHNGRRCSA